MENYLKSYSDTPKVIKYTTSLLVIANLISLGVTLVLTYFVIDLFHRPREVLLKPGQVDESLLKPDLIDPDTVMAHAYEMLTLTNGFTPDDIKARFELAYPLMTPELERESRIENEALYKMVEKQNVHHNFRVVAFPKNGPVAIIEGAKWSVSFIGRLEVSTGTGDDKGAAIIRDAPETKVIEIYIERRDDPKSGSKGLFVNRVNAYSWVKYKELREKTGETEIFSNFNGMIYEK